MKAIIQVTRKTQYATIVEMTAAEFSSYRRAIEAGGKSEREAEKELNRKIDMSDWQDDEFYRLDEFEPFVETTEQK